MQLLGSEVSLSQDADRACPGCGAEAIIFTKKDNWWCAGFKGGCGKGFKKDDPAITSQEVGRKPNPEIFDQVNTLLKMAQKRAHVSATINATSASEFFTVDIEPEEATRSQPASEPEVPADPALTRVPEARHGERQRCARRFIWISTPRLPSWGIVISSTRNGPRPLARKTPRPQPL